MSFNASAGSQRSKACMCAGSSRVYSRRNGDVILRKTRKSVPAGVWQHAVAPVVFFSFFFPPLEAASCLSFDPAPPVFHSVYSHDFEMRYSHASRGGYTQQFFFSFGRTQRRSRYTVYIVVLSTRLHAKAEKKGRKRGEQKIIQRKKETTSTTRLKDPRRASFDAKLPHTQAEEVVSGKQ